MPNLKVLSKIFLKLLYAETNLCGNDGGIIGFYESYAYFHHYNTQRSNYNDLPEIDTTCNQGIHFPVLVIDDPIIYSIPSKTSFM